MAASTDSDALELVYVELADGSVSGVVQHMGGDLVRIHVGGSAPSDSTDAYVLIGSAGDLFRSFSWSGFAAGDKVYGRADRTASVVTTIVA